MLFGLLSLAAERVTNVIKLRRPALRTAQEGADAEKNRERLITQTSVGVSIALAILVKANLFEIVTHLDAPWQTLGWLQLRGAEWFRSQASLGVSQFLYAVGGSALTGIAIAFGGKLSHDALDLLLDARRRLQAPRGGS